MKPATIGACLLSFLCITSLTEGDLVLYVDVDPVTPGIQTSLPDAVDVGTPIPVDVVVESDVAPGNLQLIDFTVLDVSFNDTPGILTWNGSATTAPAASSGAPLEGSETMGGGVVDSFSLGLLPSPPPNSGTVLTSGVTGPAKPGFTNVTEEFGVNAVQANPLNSMGLGFGASAVVWSTVFIANSPGTTTLSADGGVNGLAGATPSGRGHGGFHSLTGGFIAATTVASTIAVSPVPEPSAVIFMTLVVCLVIGRASVRRLASCRG